MWERGRGMKKEEEKKVLKYVLRGYNRGKESSRGWGMGMVVR